jgi:hypothetical protein
MPAPTDDNQFILRGFRGLFRTAWIWGTLVRHSVLFTEVKFHFTLNQYTSSRTKVARL